MKINLNKYKSDAFREYKKYSKLVGILANLRLLTFVLAILFFIIAYYYSNILNYIGFLFGLFFIILVIIHNKYYKLEHYYKNYIRVVEEYINRKNDNWHQFKDTGEDFITDKNIYLQDLDVIGKNSLFQYLNIAKTLGGRRRLYQRFCTYQNDADSISSLADDIDFCIEFQIKLLEFDGKKIDLENHYKLFSKSMEDKKIDLVVGVILSGITILFLILALFHKISFQYFYGMFLLNFFSCYLYQIIYREEFQNLTSCIFSFSKLKDIYQLIGKHHFKDKKLRCMQEKVNLSINSSLKLNRLEIFSNLKDNVIASFLFNGLFLVNILTMYLYSKVKDDKDLLLGIEVVEELEAMVSLSIMGVVKEHTCIPKNTSQIKLEFSKLYHPLLKEEKCIPNSFSTLHGVTIITGSNMGGKSTFLRTIGINLILMNAGSLVNADSFESNYFKIFTSMRVQDDAIGGISTFYGELLRMKEAIDESKNSSPMVVLVDEVFKGTNYRDRIYGAEEVIKKLNKKNILLFITTHDFELCNIKVSHLLNYHFREYYEGGKIKFDYLLRKGVCESTNARYLMEQLGIIQEK